MDTNQTHLLTDTTIAALASADMAFAQSQTETGALEDLLLFGLADMAEHIAHEVQKELDMKAEKYGLVYRQTRAEEQEDIKRKIIAETLPQLPGLESIQINPDDAPHITPPPAEKDQEHPTIANAKAGSTWGRSMAQPSHTRHAPAHEETPPAKPEPNEERLQEQINQLVERKKRLADKMRKQPKKPAPLLNPDDIERIARNYVENLKKAETT